MNFFFRYFFFIIFFIINFNVNSQKLVLPKIIIQDIEYNIEIKDIDSININTFKINNNVIEYKKSTDGIIFSHIFNSNNKNLKVQINDSIQEYKINPIPIILSIVPPLLTIIIALILKEVITSLFIGIFLGASIIGYYQFGIIGIFTGLLTALDTYILNSLIKTSHMQIIIFSLLIGAIVSVISKNGGVQGIVSALSKYAKDARGGQLVTWLLGILIFFDDYANTLIVGNTMRPLTDKLKISRQKLAYIVDSTAAPVASICFITTWIGAELGYIQDGIESIDAISVSAYTIFINSIQYSFYPIFTLFFMFILIWKQVDFSYMWKAEYKARNRKIKESILQNTNQSHFKDEFQKEHFVSHNLYHAIIPISVVVFGTVLALIYTGIKNTYVIDPNLGLLQKISLIIGNSDSYIALLWSSLLGLIVAVIISLSKKIKLSRVIETGLGGIKIMIPTMLILTLAWSLSSITEDLKTAEFLSFLVSDSVSPWILPSLTFIISLLISFSTGSSWGTMAIVYPIIIPITWNICVSNDLSGDGSLTILYNVISCVLTGSVLGDHCSPISDTTILSSLASSCNHLEHVKTQLPYAITVGLVALIFGSLATGLGLPSWIAMIIGIGVLYVIIVWKGKKVYKKLKTN